MTFDEAATPPTGTSAVLPRPRLRGWLHVWAFAVSIAAGIVLVSVAVATRDAETAAATSVYALTVSLLFGTSAVYHRVTWSTPARRALVARLDHSMIFLFIAGTYTPFALLAMPERTGRTVLAVVWAGAVGGVLLKTSWIGAPRWLTVPIYIGLGWVAVFVLPDLLRHGGVAALVLIIIGGLIYTAGGVVYALRRPDPAPQVFGYHEVFHLCTVVAATCHMVAVWLAVYAS
ncbi:MAG TPA: hemolysin III family protein [Mycobacteriales bacterium]|nr:hemolysin III family protein [Mycobacteriales bacterium]